MKTSGLALLAVTALLTVGCESILRGSEQSAIVQTEPAGADILLSDGQRCTSPCRLSVARYRTLTARIAKPGCRTSFGQLVPGVTNDTLVLASINFGQGAEFPISLEEQLFRTVYDYQLGGAYALDPNPLAVSLLCGKQAERPPLGLTRADQLLIDSFGRLPAELDIPLPTTASAPPPIW